MVLLITSENVCTTRHTKFKILMLAGCRHLGLSRKLISRFSPINLVRMSFKRFLRKSWNGKKTWWKIRYWSQKYSIRV